VIQSMRDVPVQCDAFAYISGTHMTDTESITAYRLLVRVGCTENDITNWYKMMRFLWDDHSAIKGIIDVRSLFDESMQAALSSKSTTPVSFPRLDKHDDKPITLYNSVEAQANIIHGNFWLYQNRARQILEGFENRLMSLLHGITNEANCIDRKMVTSQGSHIHPGQGVDGDIRLWTMAVNAQPVSIEVDASADNPRLYYTFHSGGGQLLGFRFLPNKALEMQTSYIPIVYEDKENLIRELDLSGLQPVELPQLLPLTAHMKQ
jgi:hypothetical protein